MVNFANASACVLSHFSHVWLCVTVWTVAHQPPLSVGFSRQEYRSGLPSPSPGDLAGSGTEPTSHAAPALQEDSLPLSHCGSPRINFLCPNSKLRTRMWKGWRELCYASRPLFYFHVWFECYFQVENKKKLCLTDLDAADNYSKVWMFVFKLWCFLSSSEPTITFYLSREQG